MSRRQNLFEYKSTFVLVTGASKGLGKALAEELAKRGANLVLVARSKPALETMAEALRHRHGVRVEVIDADLSSLDAPGRITDTLVTLGIELDLLVNNAAVGHSGSFLSRPIREELEPVMVNVHSLVALTHILGNRMVSRGRGGIINISSDSAFQPLPYNATYAATKSFVLMFSEAIAEELKVSGVKVMVAIPGATATDFFDQSPTTVRPERMDTAASVASNTLNDFARRKTISYPGRRSIRARTLLSRLFPRALIVKIAAGVARNMGFDR